MTRASVFSDGTSIASGAALTGTATTLIGAIDNAGTLTVDQPDNAIFTAALTGAGQLVKTGAGVLQMGDQAFVGATRVSGGMLLVNGMLRSAITVGGGATLGGTGSAGSVLVESGGTIATGSDGPFTVAGDFIQRAGSVHVARLVGGQPGAALLVGGRAILEEGALLALSSDTPSASVGTRYILLSAEGGISGTYAVQQDPQANVELRLSGTGNEIDGVVARTASSLIRIGGAANQAAVAGALGMLGSGNAAYAALTLDPDDGDVRGGLAQLAGEVHASLRTAMTQDVLGVERAVHSRLGNLAGEGTNLWAQFLGGHGRNDGASGVAAADRDVVGGLGGVEVALGAGAYAGLAGGYTRTTLDLRGPRSHAHLGTTHLLAYAGAEYGSLRVRGAVGYAWNHVRTRRSVAAAGFSDEDSARYRGDTLHGFGEVGYALSFHGGAIEPFARATAVRVHTDGFTETGGDAALTGEARSTTTAFSDLGVRLAVPLSETVAVDAGLSWRHAYNHLRSEAGLAFVDGGSPFDVIGTSLSRDAASPTFGVAWTPAANMRFDAGYTGVYGARGHETRGRIAFTIGL